MRPPVDRRRHHQCTANEQGNLFLIRGLVIGMNFIILGSFALAWFGKTVPNFLDLGFGMIVGGIIGFLQKSPERGVSAQNVEHMDVDSGPKDPVPPRDPE